jgi:hypothetical protein
VFSGSEILAMALKEKIEAIGVDTVMKDNIQSRLAGFGSSGSAVEVLYKKLILQKQIRLLRNLG